MPKTMTQLYSTLIPVLIKRYMIEKGEWDSHHGIPSDLEDFPKDIVLSINRVSELAYNGLLKEDIQLVFTDSDVGEGFQHLGLLSETKEMYVCEGAVSSYSFLHLSIQEFLAAWHVKCQKLASNPLLVEAKSFLLFLRYLTTFGYFIAGMIGYADLIDDDLHFGFISSFLVMWVYEAQDCSQLTLDQCLEISPSNPMEMYAFGYVLVHAPIQWQLRISSRVPFDILASSLSDHASSIDKIQGSIVGLTIAMVSDVDPRLQLLPKCLLHSITSMECLFRGHVTASVLLKWLPNVFNIQNITLHHSDIDSIDKDDYLLYELLGHFKIKKLELWFHHDITLMGIQELSTTLSSSCTIEDVTLECDNADLSLKLSGLVEAALSCSTLKYLQTNILFHILPTHQHIETMVFKVNPNFTTPATLLDCLLCIAEMCRVQSMKKLHVFMFETIPPQDYACFLYVLNNSLHQNPSMRSLKIPRFPHFNLEHIIRKDHVTVRRTKSLSDIATAIPIQTQHVPIQSRHNSVPAWQSQGQGINLDPIGSAFRTIRSQKGIPEDNGGFQHSKSCGNLLSLYDHIHPLLYKALI